MLRVCVCADCRAIASTFFLEVELVLSSWELTTVAWVQTKRLRGWVLLSALQLGLAFIIHNRSLGLGYRHIQIHPRQVSL